MSKRLGGIIGCKYKTSSWHLNGFPMVVTLLGQQYNTGEKPTVIMLYTYIINRHAGTPDKNQTTFSVHNKNRFIIIYSNSAIDPVFPFFFVFWEMSLFPSIE